MSERGGEKRGAREKGGGGGVRKEGLGKREG